MLSIETKNAAQLKAASAKVGDLDANLGGDWWREIQRTVTSTEEAVRLIRDGYVKNTLSRGRAQAGAVSEFLFPTGGWVQPSTISCSSLSTRKDFGSSTMQFLLRFGVAADCHYWQVVAS